MAIRSVDKATTPKFESPLPPPPEQVTVNAGDLETVLAMYEPKTMSEEESAKRLSETLAALDLDAVTSGESHAAARLPAET